MTTSSSSVNIYEGSKILTRQDIIREGVHDIIGDCLIKIGCGSGGCPKAERLEAEAQETCIQALLEFLDSQGVAIKVDREWPSTVYEETRLPKEPGDAMNDMVKAGYSAWESLIEGD